MTEPATDDDLSIIAWQLGREPRAVVDIAHRCPCGAPDVVRTRPRLPDGTPFPTLYYLTCPRLTSAVGSIEGSGRMREMEARLSTDADLATAYQGAHQRYLDERRGLEQVPQIDGISAGGMPDRVKCLHVLLAQALACGPGVNPLGDEVRAEVDRWWLQAPCSRAAAERAPDASPAETS